MRGGGKPCGWRKLSSAITTGEDAYVELHSPDSYEKDTESPRASRGEGRDNHCKMGSFFGPNSAFPGAVSIGREVRRGKSGSRGGRTGVDGKPALGADSRSKEKGVKPVV